MNTVDAVIPAYKPGEELRNLLWMLSKQTVPLGKIIVMITESNEGVYPDFSSFPHVETRYLKPEEFDHGNTRNQGEALCTGDYVLFMTQDAAPVNNYLVENLLKAFQEEKVAVSYARQLPKKDCHVIERYTRQFNYPTVSRIKSAEDLKTLGIRTYFCSNVCAMYDRKIFNALGGFTKKTIFNEDMIYAAEAVAAGFRISYTAEAEVFHSHNLTGKQLLKRNFDLAVSQADHPEIFKSVSSEKEGGKLVKDTALYLLKSGHFYLIPKLVYQSGMKYIGYRLGKNYKNHSLKFNKKLSSNKYYWEDQHGTD